MSQNKVETKVENLVKKQIEDLGYTLYDVQYVKEGKDYYLRITIDKDDGINIEDCEKVNRAIDDTLDEADLISESYFLEVSSPGLERILRKDWHFEKQIGNKIYVKLFQAIEKKKQFEGILTAYHKENLELAVEGEKILIETKNIAIAKTVCELF